MLTKQEFDDIILKVQNLLAQYAENEQKHMLNISSSLVNDMNEYIENNYSRLENICNILNDEKVQDIWRQDSWYMYGGFRYHSYSDGLFCYAVTNKGKIKHWSISPRTAQFSNEYVISYIQVYGHEPGFKHFGHNIVQLNEYYIGLYTLPQCVVGNILNCRVDS